MNPRKPFINIYNEHLYEPSRNPVSPQAVYTTLSNLHKPSRNPSRNVLNPLEPGYEVNEPSANLLEAINIISLYKTNPETNNPDHRTTRGKGRFIILIMAHCGVGGWVREGGTAVGFAEYLSRTIAAGEVGRDLCMLNAHTYRVKL